MTNKRAKFAVLCIFVILAVAAVPVGFAAETGSNLVRRATFDNAGYSAEFIAQVTDLYTSHIEQGWKVLRIHQLRPELICMLYRNMRAVTPSSTEWQTAQSNNWILKDASGIPIKSTVYNYYIVDVGNLNYQTWLANWAKSAIVQYGFDGVSLDNCLPSTEIMWSTSPGPAINPRTGKAYTADEFKQAVINLVNKIKDTIGNKLVSGNVVYYGQRFFDSSRNKYYVDLMNQSRIDSIQSEGWIMILDTIEWYSESKWQASIDFAVWLENNFLNKGGKKMFLPISQNAAPYERPGEALPAGTTREQYVTYVFTSLLLGVKTNSSYLNFGYATDNYTQGLFKIDVGNPTGNYYMIGGTHVYAREYSKTKILVNPTNTSYSITLEAGLATLDGKSLSSPLTVKPHTGIILKKSGNVTPPPPTGFSFQNGFETGGFGGWNGTYVTRGETTRVVGTLTHSGTYSARFTTDGASAFARTYAYASTPNTNVIHAKAYVYIDAGLPLKTWESLYFIQLCNSSGSVLASYGIRADRVSTKWALTYGGKSSFATSGPIADRWYLIEAYFTKAATGRTLTLSVNGLEVASLIVDTSTANSIGLVRCGIGYNDPGYAMTVYIDDVAINN